MKKYFFAVILLLSGIGCVSEGDYVTVLIPSEELSYGTSELSLNFEGAIEVSTKSILGSGVDSKVSGGMVAVYNAATGLLDSEWEVADFSSPLKLKLPYIAKVNIYVIGNLWHIGPSGERIPIAFPKREVDLAALEYRMDGSPAGSGRTETFAEASEYGIPIVGSVKSVDLARTSSVSVGLRRLFAKLTLTIDHSGLDGGKNVDWFRNVNLYLRQANVRLSLFGAASKAQSETDVVSQSDYDPSMSNGHAVTYTFFVPENRHGTFPTYIEFNGKVDPSAGGYGGSVCYRFHIGSGKDGDYDVEGNQNYLVTLGFKAGSLFAPEWRVSLGEDWSDRRILCLSADSAGSNLLSGGSVIAVRKNRAATCWLYYNRQGSGVNEASMLTACDGTFAPADISAAAWRCEAPELSRYGISLGISGNKLTFNVTDPSKFVSGRRIPVNLHLYPGDIVTQATLTTYDDIAVTVSGAKSLTDGFYIGMSRTLTVSGLAGSRVYYWNGYGVDRLSIKPVTSKEADWIHNSKSSSQSMPAGGALKLCAYQQTNGNQFVLNLASDDPFNDGEYLLRSQVVVQAPKSRVTVSQAYLPFDGTGVTVPFDYLDKDGKVLAEDSFDPDIYSQIMVPGIVWSDNVDAAVPKWIGNDGTEIYLKSYYADGAFIGDRTEPLGGFFGPVNFGPSDRSLASGVAQVMLYVRAPKWYSVFPDQYSEYYNTSSSSDITANAVALVYDGASYTAECSGGSKYGETLTEGSQNGDRRPLTWKFSDSGRRPDGLAPVGPQTVSLVFTNKKSGEQYRLSSTFDIYHNVTLRPLVLFELNATYARVLATSAKNAWLLRRYCAKESGVPYLTSFLGLNNAAFSQYVTMKYEKASGRNRTTLTTYRGSCLLSGSYSYQDFAPSAYGKGYKWTAARIEEFSDSGSALTYLGFCNGDTTYTPLATPLAPSYVGRSPYIYLTASNMPMGCLTLP